MKFKRAVIYARISVSKDESVAVESQLAACRNFCAALGWEVVGEYRDDGVSATRVKPEDREGWRAVLEHPDSFDVALVWRADRLARKVIDFLHADETLRARGAALATVVDHIDMSTPNGRLFATLLASFAQAESDSMRERAAASRADIIKQGRRAGGRPPFGYMNVENPNGPGKVLAHDPERISLVRGMAARALAGDSLYSIGRWLESQNVAPRARRGKADQVRWHDASVEAVLRSPALAGMTPFRGDLLRDETGIPMVDRSLAVISPSDRRLMLQTLDAAKKPGTRQLAGKTPALLKGVVRCGSCDRLMHRATAAKSYAQYRCQQRGCVRQVGINRPALEKFVADLVLAERGDRLLVKSLPVVRDNAVELVEIEAAIRDTTDRMASDDDADLTALGERLRALKAKRAEARSSGDRPGDQWKVTGRTLAQEWARVGDDVEARRQLLLGQLEAVRVLPGGGRGKVFDGSRVLPVWRVPTEAEARMLEAWTSLPLSPKSRT